MKTYTYNYNYNNYIKTPISPALLRGVTLIELLTAVSVVAAMVFVGVPTYQSLSQGASSTSLTTHVKQLNAALEIYEANGGVVGENDDVSTVLLRLKTAAADESGVQLAGLSGSMIDRQLVPVFQTEEEAGRRGAKRAVWNGGTKRFEIAETGEPGILRFAIGDTLPSAEETEGLSGREVSLRLASNSGWIWDYDSHSTNSSGGPRELDQLGLAEYPAISSGLSGGLGYGVPPTPVPLGVPLFSPEGGEYDYRDFNLEVTLTNPNSANHSRLIYSVNGDSWAEYEEGQVILVAPADTVQAMAVSTNSQFFTDSETRDEDYQSVFTISGATEGEFFNPTGGEDMTTGGSGSLFEWGSPYYAGGYTDPSWMLFNGASFHEVAAEERFVVGQLTYYNGTIYSGSGADSIDLSIELAFNDSESRDFEFTMELVNTPNSSNQRESADYVHLDQVYSAVGQSLGGVDYELILEFGETTDEGFSSIRNFHVFEGGTATGTLYGTLVATGDEY